MSPSERYIAVRAMAQLTETYGLKVAVQCLAEVCIRKAIQCSLIESEAGHDEFDLWREETLKLDNLAMSVEV